MKKNEKNSSNAINVVKVEFEKAAEFMKDQNLSFSATCKKMGVHYAPANKNFDPDTLKKYGIASDSSANCFRGIFFKDGQYKIYRALEKYTTNKTSSEKLLKAFNTFIWQHDFSETGLCEHVEAIHKFLSDRVASEAAARELAKKERERAKEAAKIEKVTAKVRDAIARDAMMEQLKKQLAALQNMQF